MSIALVWFRQDLRCSDNPALAMACHEHKTVVPLYIRDNDVTPIGGAQRWWLHHSLCSLEKTLKKINLSLILREGSACEIITTLVQQLSITSVYWNRCYDPSMIKRDTLIKQALIDRGIHVVSSNGSLLNEPWTIKNQSGAFFKVFTPYWRHCLRHINVQAPATIKKHPEGLAISTQRVEDWHLLPTKPNWAESFESYWQPGEDGAHKKLDRFIQNHLNNYDIDRNIPSYEATSKLSPHLHFGEISPFQIWRTVEPILAHQAHDASSIECFLSELGWREFSYYLLYHFPELPLQNYKSEFDAFPWQKSDTNLKAWQQGNTGYPIVDAGMRELWHTGFMQNRVRMIVASFLTKNLFIDWRIGADWFLDTLLDADLASNSASWQWVAGSGADASPYYRIFNPVLQGEKFDPDGVYIRRWVPELAQVANKRIHQPWAATPAELGLSLGHDYPHPLVDHSETRKLALAYYQAIKNKQKPT